MHQKMCVFIRVQMFSNAFMWLAPKRWFINLSRRWSPNLILLLVFVYLFHLFHCLQYSLFARATSVVNKKQDIKLSKSFATEHKSPYKQTCPQSQTFLCCHKPISPALLFLSSGVCFQQTKWKYCFTRDLRREHARRLLQLLLQTMVLCVWRHRVSDSQHRGQAARHQGIRWHGVPSRETRRLLRTPRWGSVSGTVGRGLRRSSESTESSIYKGWFESQNRCWRDQY